MIRKPMILSTHFIISYLYPTLVRTTIRALLIATILQTRQPESQKFNNLSPELTKGTVEAGESLKTAHLHIGI